MNQNEKGMKVYNNILQSARASNQPIGPEHHLHDKHYKKWDGDPETPSKDTVEQLEELKVAPKTLSVKRVKATELSKRNLESPKPKKEENEDERQARLMEKYRLLQKKKLADSLKCDSRTDHIKSVGNGL